MMKEVLAETESEVVAYAGADFLKDETFVAPEGIKQLGDAGGGKMWAIGQIDVEGSVTPAGLVRLHENGSRDLSFDPVFQKYSRPLRSSSASTLFFHYVPRPRDFGRTEFYPVAFISYLDIEKPGVGTWREIVETPFGYSERLTAVDSEGVALLPSFDLQYLHRSLKGIVDPLFQIPLAGPEIPVLGPPETQCVSYQPEGGILVGGTRRFMADGTSDDSWKQPRVSRRAVIQGLHKRPNGEIFVFGDFDRVDGEEFAGMVSLDASGEVIQDFRPKMDLRSAKQVRERSDGKILVASEHERHSGIARNPRLIFLDAEGSFLGNLPPIPPDLFFDRINLIAFDLLSDDGIVFTIRKPATRGERIYLRYLPPGETDGQSALVWPIYSRYLEHPLVLADERFIAGNDLASAEIPRLGTLDGVSSSFVPVGQDEQGFLYGFDWRRPFGNFQRSHPDHGFDASFQANLHRRGGIYQVAFSRGGKILAMLRADPYWIDTNSDLVRFHRDGRLDGSFKVEVPGYEKAYLHDILAVGDHLWVAGEFSEIGGKERHGLALVDARGDRIPWSSRPPKAKLFGYLLPAATWTARAIPRRDPNVSGGAWQAIRGPV